MRLPSWKCGGWGSAAIIPPLSIIALLLIRILQRRRLMTTGEAARRAGKPEHDTLTARRQPGEPIKPLESRSAAHVTRNPRYLDIRPTIRHQFSHRKEEYED